MARTRAALLITVTEREARVQGSLVRGTRSSVPQVGCDDAQIPLEGLTRRVQEQPCRLLHDAVPVGIDGRAGQHEARGPAEVAQHEVGDVSGRLSAEPGRAP